MAHYNDDLEFLRAQRNIHLEAEKHKIFQYLEKQRTATDAANAQSGWGAFRMRPDAANWAADETVKLLRRFDKSESVNAAVKINNVVTGIGNHPLQFVDFEALWEHLLNTYVLVSPQSTSLNAPLEQREELSWIEKTSRDVSRSAFDTIRILERNSLRRANPLPTMVASPLAVAKHSDVDSILNGQGLLLPPDVIANPNRAKVLDYLTNSAIEITRDKMLTTTKRDLLPRSPSSDNSSHPAFPPLYFSPGGRPTPHRNRYHSRGKGSSEEREHCAVAAPQSSVIPAFFDREHRALLALKLREFYNTVAPYKTAEDIESVIDRYGPPDGEKIMWQDLYKKYFPRAFQHSNAPSSQSTFQSSPCISSVSPIGLPSYPSLGQLATHKASLLLNPSFDFTVYVEGCTLEKRQAVRTAIAQDLRQALGSLVDKKNAKFHCEVSVTRIIPGPIVQFEIAMPHDSELWEAANDLFVDLVNGGSLPLISTRQAHANHLGGNVPGLFAVGVAFFAGRCSECFYQYATDAVRAAFIPADQLALDYRIRKRQKRGVPRVQPLYFFDFGPNSFRGNARSESDSGNSALNPLLFSFSSNPSLPAASFFQKNDTFADEAFAKYSFGSAARSFDSNITAESSPEEVASPSTRPLLSDSETSEDSDEERERQRQERALLRSATSFHLGEDGKMYKKFLSQVWGEEDVCTNIATMPTLRELLRCENPLSSQASPVEGKEERRMEARDISTHIPAPTPPSVLLHKLQKA